MNLLYTHDNKTVSSESSKWSEPLLHSDLYLQVAFLLVNTIRFFCDAPSLTPPCYNFFQLQVKVLFFLFFATWNIQYVVSNATYQINFTADGGSAHLAPPLPCLVGAAKCLWRGQSSGRVQPSITSWSGKLCTHARTHTCFSNSVVTLAEKADGDMGGCCYLHVRAGDSDCWLGNL